MVCEELRMTEVIDERVRKGREIVLRKKERKQSRRSCKGGGIYMYIHDMCMYKYTCVCVRVSALVCKYMFSHTTYAHACAREYLSSRATQ